MLERRVVLGRGRGGAVRLAESPADGVPAAVTPLYVQPQAEADTYGSVSKGLRGWAEDNVGQRYVLHITAAQGRRSTGGTWTRPDIAIVAVQRYPCVPGKFLRVVTFEVKTPANFDVTSVFEALAHLSFATEAYVVLAGEATEENETLGRARDMAAKHGVGLLVTGDRFDSHDTWTVQVEARPQPISDPESLNEFLQTQLPADKVALIQEWAR
ncbi:MAG: hypothetical protein ACRD17_08165 [Terriglobales bacterium]